MAIVSKLPFKLSCINPFSKNFIQEATCFYEEEREVWESGNVGLVIEEHENIDILFHAKDKKARLYLEALDIIPPSEAKVEYDELGRIYREPSEEAFSLYNSEKGYDALCVDVFQISIFCEGKWYYSALQVNPKPMSLGEWTMMKDELEKEMTGLAQDIVRRNIGIGNLREGNLPPKALHNFIVIKKYAKQILTALMDIADNPRYEIVTRYKKVLSNKNCRLDEESVRRYVKRAGSEPTYKVPEKAIHYDIQDNRLLKRFLVNYENSLTDFLDLLEKSSLTAEGLEGKGSQYQREWEKSIKEFHATAIKLKKMTALLKTKEWYQDIKEITSAHLPHSFIMDNRYNTMYQMFLELNKETFQMKFDPEFSYTWKRSSYLYEMWCFLKLCNLLTKSYEMDMPSWKSLLTEKMLFPFLKTGTIVNFLGEKVSLKVVFDTPLPYSAEGTSLESPLFIAVSQANIRAHNRPDILIHVYDTESHIYLGTILLECKYRKLFSFWNKDNNRSSLGQLQAYYNNSRSKFQFNGAGKEYHINPIYKVIVLTPDVQGDGEVDENHEILVKGFKPSNSDEWVASLERVIIDNIERLKKAGDRFCPN